MAIPNQQLVLDKFIEVNVERYADKPALVQMFQTLTLGDIVITNGKRVTGPQGQVAVSYDIEKAGVFTSKNQMFYAADVAIHDVMQWTANTPVAVDDLPKQTEGLYLDTEGKAHIVVMKGKKEAEHVLDVFMAGALYEIGNDDTEVSPETFAVTVDGLNIIGAIETTESLYDDIPRYNGQFRYDGTIRY